MACTGGRKPTGQPPGRPQADIDWDQVDKWLIAGNKGTAIAAQLGIDNETLYGRCLKDKNMGFSEYSQQKRAIGDAMIERTQFQVGVIEKNTTMLVWLGKARLGQREQDQDKVQVDPKLLESFQSFMSMLNAGQSALSMPKSNQSTDSISE
jgi:hypothetical protein